MIYSVEVTENGFIEKLEIAGNIYYKKWINTDTGEKCEDEEFYQQIENNGIKDETILEKIYDIIDSSFFACHFAGIETYTVDDFIEEINSAYDTAKRKKFDSIVLAIDTNMEQTYYINDTENGFQCDEFDFYFDELDSIAETLYNKKIIGKPVEIRIE